MVGEFPAVPNRSTPDVFAEEKHRRDISRLPLPVFFFFFSSVSDPRLRLSPPRFETAVTND